MTYRWMGALALLLGVGCVGSEAERQQQSRALEACRGDASNAEVADNILISEEYARSLETSLTITWLPTLFVIDFVALYAQTIVGAVTGHPTGWTFDAGVYRNVGVTATIELRVTTTEASGYGPAGTAVIDDIFALESYLEGAMVTPNQDGSVTIAYAEPGPLVELWGLGPTPPNPLTLTPAEQDAIIENLSTLAIGPDYIAMGVTEHLLWDFHWTSEPETFQAISQGDVPIDIELVAVNATRDDTSQRLTTETWAVDQHGGDVGGYTTFTVDGGAFPFRGRIDFTSVPFGLVVAERDLDCP